MIIFFLQCCKQGIFPPEYPCGTGQKLSQARGAEASSRSPRGRRERNNSGVYSEFLLVSASARECWRLLVPTSWGLWPQHSPGSVQCSKKPTSEPCLPGAPIEAEAVGAGAALEPAAREEAPQGGAGAQIPAASKMETLSAWPSPPAPGHLLMPVGSVPTGVRGLPGHLEETCDQGPAWPAALQVPQGVGRCRARGQGDLLVGGNRAPFLG